MPSVGACRSELAELVTDHILRDKNRDEFVTVVNGQCMPYEFGWYRRTAGPGFDDLFLIGFAQLLYLFQEMIGDVRTFFD
jgi:hypothetical protein